MTGIAQKLASNQKQVAISEFFEKNKHFLGFDSLARSLITAVKEAVDNALDACEEARILPTIRVVIEKIDTKKDIIKLVVEDNGPGIPQKSIEKGVRPTAVWIEVPRDPAITRPARHRNHWRGHVLPINDGTNDARTLEDFW